MLCTCGYRCNEQQKGKEYNNAFHVKSFRTKTGKNAPDHKAYLTLTLSAISALIKAFSQYRILYFLSGIVIFQKHANGKESA